jgi:hypothetical protein
MFRLAGVKRLAALLNTNSGLVTAAATVALALLTAVYIVLNARYLSVTETMVQLQETPQVALWLAPPVNSRSLIIKNFGPDPVVDVQGAWTAYMHRGLGPVLGPNVGEFFRLPASPATPGPGWLTIPSLAPGQVRRLSLSAVLANIGHDVDSLNVGLARTRQRPVATVHLVITVRYRRQVDRKQYRLQVSADVRKDANTGKYFMEAAPIVPPEPAFSPSY